MNQRAGHALRTAYFVASIAGVEFFVMSVALLGVWPGRVLDRQVRMMSAGDRQPGRRLRVSAALGP